MADEPIDGARTEYLTMNEFQDALVSASPGETIVYATGEIAGSGAPLSREFKGLKRLVQEHHDAGLVLLTQKRLGPRRYEYRATKRAIPRPVQYFRDSQDSLPMAAE